MPLELTIQQWRSGEQLLATVPADQRAAVDRVTDSIYAELRRQLGGPFTVAELVGLYEQGTTWCTDLAYAIAPSTPTAWDPRITADAAFGRYLRAATDYAGGRTGL